MSAPATRPSAKLIGVAVVVVVLALFIARVFDSPTSVWLLLALMAAALGGTFYWARQGRR